MVTGEPIEKVQTPEEEEQHEFKQEVCQFGEPTVKYIDQECKEEEVADLGEHVEGCLAPLSHVQEEGTVEGDDQSLPDEYQSVETHHPSLLGV